jgi:cell wall-associated NlpC family hydrolase
LAPTAPTTTVPATTTTTVPPWTANVPGPPPPATIAASPADIAKADQLEKEIVTQSNVLDILASQYDEAQQKVTATAATLAQIDAQLAAAHANAAAAQANVDRADQTLRNIAVDAYVSLGDSASGSDALLNTYEQGAAQTGAETALGKALGQVQQLHQAESRLRATETAIVKEDQQASDANTAAQAAAAQAQAAAQAATNGQQQLLLTVSQVGGGNLAKLVAAAQAAEAQAAYTRFSTSGSLDFAPSAVLRAPSTRATLAVQVAMAQVGKAYIWGAAGPDTFDCSGLTMWSWAQAGVAIPRVAADQQAWATPVPISQLAPGDLVFFGNPAHHVGMYVGGGLMVDAPHSGATVSVVPIWWDDLAGFGRVHSP